jgi:hypothetical protein
MELNSSAGVPTLELSPFDVEGLDPVRLIEGEALVALSLRPISVEGVPSLELNAENLDIGADDSPKDNRKFGLRADRLPTIGGRFDAAIRGGPITSPLMVGDEDKTSCELPLSAEVFVELLSRE